jgi:hypothetical protein
MKLFMDKELIKHASIIDDNLTSNIIHRFHKNIKYNKNNECWEKSKSFFYGIINGKIRNVSSYRLSYCIYNKLELKDIIHLRIYHTCHNKICVNPEHLTTNNNHELTKEEIFEILFGIFRGKYQTISQILNKYNTTKQIIYDILNNKIYSKISYDFPVPLSILRNRLIKKI